MPAGLNTNEWFVPVLFPHGVELVPTVPWGKHFVPLAKDGWAFVKCIHNKAEYVAIKA